MVKMWRTRKNGSKCGAPVKMAQNGKKCGALAKMDENGKNVAQS